MAKASDLGNVYGYKAVDQLTCPLAPTLGVYTLTPADADLHDISKEGILITHVQLKQLSGPAGVFIHLALFNKTSNNNAKTNYKTAAWKDVLNSSVTGAAYSYIDPTRNLDLTSLPGGGVPLVADFITFTGIANAAMASDAVIEFAFYYRWIDINSDAYRALLYSRSI